MHNKTKSGKTSSIWKLSNMLLSNPQLKTKNHKRNFKNILNENKRLPKVMGYSQSGAIALNSCIRKDRKAQVNSNLQHKEIKKRTNQAQSKQKEII